MHSRSNEFPVAKKEAFHSERGLEDGNNFLWVFLFVCEQGENLAVWEEAAALEIRWSMCDARCGDTYR